MSEEDGEVLLRATLLAACVLAATAAPALGQTTVNFIEEDAPAASEILVTGDEESLDDNIDVAQSGSTYTITRRNGAIQTDTPDDCTEDPSRSRVICDLLSPVPSFSIDLAAGNDTLTTNNVT